ncbi:hypothetical protein FCULG_00012447 [Fusarium culmorum]|uniref:BTB domain-containing protein n=1 Tax=Fusarium culmorum TaxID=5516 RepID=A0A2T4GYI4_FUSCU|nr:hypothetical protein FCULG_00012447 [Fusarium culmorum]
MKRSLLNFDHRGDALLTLRRPNAQKIPWSRSKKSLSSEAVHKNEESGGSSKNLRSIQPCKDDGQPNEIQFRVSTRNLCLVSSVFRAMIEGRYRESHPNPQGLLELGASEWNVEAFVILLNIMHGHHRQVTKTPTLELIAHIGILVDYYDCLEVVEIFYERWTQWHLDLKKHNYPELSLAITTIASQTFGPDETVLLFIALVFKNYVQARGLFGLAVFNTDGPLGTDLAIPNRVLEREKLVEELLEVLFDLQDCLMARDLCCTLECACRLLGYLTRQMRSFNLPLTKPERPYLGYSAKRVHEMLRSLKAPGWCTDHNNEPCTLEVVLQDFYVPWEPSIFERELCELK